MDKNTEDFMLKVTKNNQAVLKAANVTAAHAAAESMRKLNVQLSQTPVTVMKAAEINRDLLDKQLEILKSTVDTNNKMIEAVKKTQSTFTSTEKAIKSANRVLQDAKIMNVMQRLSKI